MEQPHPMAQRIHATNHERSLIVEPMKRTFQLLTNGQDLEIDVIGICIDAIEQLPPEDRRRVLDYLAERYQRSRNV